MENKLVRQIEDRILNLQIGINRQNKSFDDSRDSKLKDISSQLSTFRQAIDSERKKRFEQF